MRRKWTLGAIALLGAGVLLGLAVHAHRAPGTRIEERPRTRASQPSARLRGIAEAPQASGRAEAAADVAPAAMPGREEARFRVFDRSSGAPIADALVRTGRDLRSKDPTQYREARTDASGRARLAMPPPGGKCAVRKVGYRVWWQWAVSAEEVAVALEPLEPLPGRVVDASGVPVAGATVIALDGSSKFHDADLPLVTDREGRFTVAGVEFAGFISFFVSAPGYATRHVHCDPAAQEVVLTLGEGAVVEGVVMDASGRPVAGARVTADWNTTAVADAEGRYRLAGFEAPRELTLAARGPEGQRGQTEPFALQSARSRRHVPITVHAVGTVEIVARDAATRERMELARLRCRLEPLERSKRSGSAYLRNENDLPRFQDVPPGRHRLIVESAHDGGSRPYLLPPAQEVVVAPGALARVELLFERGITARGSILDPRGRARRAHVVFRARHRGVEQECRAEAEGTFELSGIPPGVGTLTLTCALSGLERTWEGIEARDDLGTFPVPAGGTVEGRLPSTPEGARVHAIIVGGRLHHREGRDVHADAEGRFRLEDLPAERPFDLHLKTKGGRERLWTGLLLGAGEVRDLGQMSWTTRAEARGRVVDAHGDAVVGARVTLLCSHGAPSAPTDAHGRFRLLKPPGVLTAVRVDRDGHPAGLFPPPTTDAQDDMLLRLSRPGRLRLRFVRVNGEPMSGASFRLSLTDGKGEGTGELTTECEADGDGWIDVLLPPGTWQPAVWGGLGGDIVGGPHTVRVEEGADASLLLEVR